MSNQRSVGESMASHTEQSGNLITVQQQNSGAEAARLAIAMAA